MIIMVDKPCHINISTVEVMVKLRKYYPLLEYRLDDTYTVFCGNVDNLLVNFAKMWNFTTILGSNNHYVPTTAYIACI